MSTTHRNELAILTLAAETESKTIVRTGCAGAILATFSVTATDDAGWSACLVVVTQVATVGGAKFLVSAEGTVPTVVERAIVREGSVHDNGADAMAVALRVSGWA